MRIGVPTEIKSNEFRVGLVPGSVRELAARGHEVIVQSGAGAGIFADDATTRGRRPHRADGRSRVRRGRDDRQGQGASGGRVSAAQARQILFTYLHLAPDPEQARGLMESGAAAIAYETVTDVPAGFRCSRR